MRSYSISVWCRPLLFFIPLSGCLQLASPAVARQWVDNTGQYRVEAEFVKLSGTQVHLRKSNGKVIAVPLDRLSREDLEQVRKLAVEILATQPALEVEKEVVVPPSVPTLAEASSTLPEENSGELASVLVHQGLTPDWTVRSVVTALANHQPRAVWDALPKSYQADIETLLPAYARQIDAELWNAVVPVLRKSILVVHKQRTFLSEHPVVKLAFVETGAKEESASPSTDSIANASSSEASWDALVGALVTLAKSDLADRDRLLVISPGEFLETTGAKIMRQLSEASRLSTQDDFNQGLQLLSQMEVSVISADGDNAIVQLKSANQVASNQMVRVEGKWIPADVATAWPWAMNEARQGLVWMESAAKSEQREQWLHALHSLEAGLDQLLAAGTQEEFNGHLATLLSQIRGKTFSPEPSSSSGVN